VKGRTRYTDGPVGQVSIVRDFLPPPEELAFKEDLVKVTLRLSKSSVDFLKGEAKKQGKPYQKLIRRLLDAYVAQHLDDG